MEQYMIRSRRIRHLVVTLCLVFVAICVWRQVGTAVFLHPLDIDLPSLLRTSFKADQTFNQESKPYRYMVKVGSLELYIQSIFLNYHRPYEGKSNIVINVWDEEEPSTFVCCFEEPTGNLVASRAERIVYIGERELKTSQYICTAPRDFSVGPRVFISPTTCGENLSQSISIVYPEDGGGKMAICAKVIYGRPDPHFLIEWFELQRILGISRIQAFEYNVHEDSRRILKYYSDRGFLKLFPWELPKAFQKDRGLYISYTSSHQQQRTYSDEQLAIFDCQERLAGYSLVTVLDLDEIIVPNGNMMLPSLFQNLMNITSAKQQKTRGIKMIDV